MEDNVSKRISKKRAVQAVQDFDEINKDLKDDDLEGALKKLKAWNKNYNFQS